MNKTYATLGKAVLDSLPNVDVEGPKYERIQMNQFQAMTPGSVVLVRSASVPFLEDHFFVITGPLVQKNHGLRPQGISIKATCLETAVLDQYMPVNGVTLLKMSDANDIMLFMNNYKLSDIVL